MYMYIYIYLNIYSLLLIQFFQKEEIFLPSTITVETKPYLVLDNQFEIAIVSTWSSNLSSSILSPPSLSLSLCLSSYHDHVCLSVASIPFEYA